MKPKSLAGGSVSGGLTCALALCVCAGLTRPALAQQESGPPKADANTIALLRFDETQGVIAKDASGHGHRAGFKKAPQEPKWYKYGRFGGCIALDGVNADKDGNKQGDADGLVWRRGASADPKGTGFTAEMWVRHAHVNGPQFYLAHTGGSHSAGRYIFGQSGGSVRLDYWPGGAKAIRIRTPRCLRPGVWRHVAFTYDGQKVRIYVDGVERASGQRPGKIAAGSDTTILGQDTDQRPSQIRGVCGLIDELRISNIARKTFPKGPYKTKDPMPDFLIKIAAEAKTKARARPMRSGPKRDFLEPEPIVRDVVVTGVVFEDVNGNGKRDPGEEGMKNVWVTNGEEIKRTPITGAYEFRFKAEEYRFVYITLPNGYKTTTSWHYLIKQEDKATRYREFDFGLQHDPASLDKNFVFLVAADSQFRSAGEGAKLKADMAQITRCTGKPRFYTIAGDLTMTGWLQEWKWYAEAIAELTIPCYNIFGGHGGNYGRATRLKRGSVHHFNMYCGPAYYSWNYGGRHFLSYNSVAGGFMSKAAQARQRAWTKADLDMLEPGTEVVTVSHYPFDLSRWRKDLKHVVCLYGHWHENNLHYSNQVPYMCTNAIRGGDWGAFTRTIRYCEFKDGKLITELRPTGQYKRVEFIHPQPDGELPKGASPIRVLAFDTASRVTQVDARIGKSEIKLKKLGQFTWGADLDATRMAPGPYELSVTVKDDRPESWPVKQCKFKITGRPVAAGKVGEDWPMFFKSLKELRTTNNEVTPPLDLVWSVPTRGQNMWAVTPIVHRGRVYVGTENENIGQGMPSVQCYDPATGKLLWRTEVNASVRFCPAAADGRIYVATNTGGAYCLDAETGRVVWQSWVNPERSGHHSTKCAVLLYRDKVLMWDDYMGISVLDAQTGKKLKSLGRPGGNLYYSGPFPDGDRLWVPTRYSASCISLTTGKPFWRVKTRKLGTRGVAMGVVHNGVYYQRSRSNVAAFDPADGKVLWKTGCSGGCWGVPVPTIADGVIYAGGTRVAAIDLKTHERLWYYTAMRGETKSNRRQSFGGHSSPLVSGNLVYLGREDGDLLALDRKSGKPVWRFNLGVPVKSSPVVSGNMLFICDFDGNLHAFASRSM